MYIILLFFIFNLNNNLICKDTSIVSSITIEGNKIFSDAQLITLFSTKPGTVFSDKILKEDVEALTQLYQNQGYYFIDINTSCVFSEDSNFVDIIFNISEGNEILIGEILIEGNTVFTVDEILNQFQTKTGDLLIQKILEKDIELLLHRYSRVGYPLASVQIQDVTFIEINAEKKLKIVLQIIEGPKIYIREFQVQGNNITKEDVVLRETGLSIGELYNQNRIDKIVPRLNRLGIFSKVSAPELYLLPEGGGISITVEEGLANNFDGIVGYVPGSENVKRGYLTGLINISMRNLFGTARKLHLRWLKDEQYSHEIEIRYTEPWIFNLPINLGGALLQRRQDTTYVKWSMSGKAEVRFSDIVNVSGLLGYENTIPSVSLAQQIVWHSRTTTTGVELQIDSRDDIRTPTSGVKYRNDYQIGIKRILNFPPNRTDIKTRSTIQKISLDAEMYLPLFIRQILMFGIHGRQINVANIQISDMYRFGGTHTLRGYRENQFIGSRIAWTNTEYRFIVERHSYVYGFFDVGYYVDQNNDEHMKYGYGIGARVETPIGLIGVSIGLGKGDTFNQSKIHFGLMNEF